MKYIFSFLLIISTLWSQELTQQQLKLLQAAGYSQSEINSKLKSLGTSKNNEVKKEVEVKNNISNDHDQNNQNEKYQETTKKLVDKNSDESRDSSEASFENEIKLEKFGNTFFNNKNELNSNTTPAPQNYLVNINDTLDINIFGPKNENLNLEVQNDGTILIPQVGEVKINGLEYSEVKDLLTSKIKQAYPNTTNVIVKISEFTNIQVTVTGLVQAPGIYNLPSFSSIKDALFATNGVLENGSYRNIILKRNGKQIKKIDLYDLIRFGKNSDVMLSNGDIILVESIKNEVSIKGEINFEAKYEFLSKESYKDLINIASGFTSKANTNLIRLKRYENNEIKVLNLTKDELFKMKPLNGDELEVVKLVDSNASLVKISGNVHTQGNYELPKDYKLSTLFKNALKIQGKNGLFKKNTNYSYAVIEDVKGKNTSFNLQKVLDGESDTLLSLGDEIKIFVLDEFVEKPYFYAKGDVVDSFNRKYDFVEGLKAKDLFNIVKFKRDTLSKEDEELTKENLSQVNKALIIPDLNKLQIIRIENRMKVSYLIDISQNGDFLIKPYDEIEFFEFDKINEVKKASIKGEVFIPGSYNITDTTTILDLIKLAGGYTNKAQKTICELSRYEIIDNKRERKIYKIDLKKAFDLKLLIHPDDEWIIYPIENWKENKYVEIKGEVKYPGIYSIVDGEKLSNLIQRAGGFTNSAFVEGAVFTREEVKELQQKRMQDTLARLKTKALQLNASTNDAGENSSDKQNILNAVKQLEDDSKDNMPIGRISLELYYDLARFENSQYNITLKDNDTLYIPTINDTVSVVGEVLNQNTFIYNNDLDLEDYISKAGGITDIADEEMIFVVKSNGEAFRIEKSYLWSDNNKIFKGDTIVVPMKLETVSNISFAKDITSIMYQLAVTAASLKTVGGL